MNGGPLAWLLMIVCLGAGPVAAAVFLRTVPDFLWRALHTTARCLGPWRPGAPDPRVETPGGVDEPAHLAYWYRQVWTDVTSAAQSGVRAARYALVHYWFGRLTRNLLGGRRPSGPQGKNAFTRAVMVIVGLGTGVGAGAAAVVSGLVFAAVLLLFLPAVALVCAALATAALAVRAGERVLLLVRGVRMACPHPGCYRRIARPAHTCPACQARHGRLRPGRYGVLRRVCVCGTTLRTVRSGGSDGPAPQCPYCEQRLPRALGTARTVHLPVLGGTSSGKTMLLAAVVGGLASWDRRGLLTMECATRHDADELAALSRQLDGQGWAHATTARRPRALMLLVSRGRRRRLLYLYDPMGESLRDPGSVREQQYLAHADGVVLVVDALAEPGVRATLTGDDGGRAVAARPSPEGPTATYERLTGEMQALTGRRGRTPVAAVVTKRDVLDQLVSLPVPGPRIDVWLESVGLGNLVRGLGHDFGRTRYWAVSAHAATGVGALDGEQRRAAEPVLWLLGHTGFPVRKLLTEETGTPVKA
ncbi:TRAFAC clade GTPase domain-containing protein [Streptomyces sp. URMC 126]|uniref:TRAFAC clade GTPase domain-containing protein n=1 Tax=Streptomyces sp. URMC 126 TaxID=3423401 RepID=UPI003F1E1692